MELNGTERVPVIGEVNWNPTINQIKDFVRPYKIYRALISQTGTSAPTEIAILENTFGMDAQFNYVSPGEYYIELPGINDSNTYISYTNMNGPTSSGYTIDHITNSGSVSLYSFAFEELSNNILNYCSIEIIKY